MSHQAPGGTVTLPGTFAALSCSSTHVTFAVRGMSTRRLQRQAGRRVGVADVDGALPAGREPLLLGRGPVLQLAQRDVRATPLRLARQPA